MKALYISLIILVLFTKMASTQSFSANTFQGVGWTYLYTREDSCLSTQAVMEAEGISDNFEYSSRVVGRTKVEWRFSETVYGKPPSLTRFFSLFYLSGTMR
ncbi:MAG: hypothetical protein ACFB15_30720 [Cyclobacteriaceae bacterium]